MEPVKTPWRVLAKFGTSEFLAIPVRNDQKSYSHWCSINIYNPWWKRAEEGGQNSEGDNRNCGKGKSITQRGKKKIKKKKEEQEA